MKRCRKCCHWLMDFNHQSRGSRTIDCFKIKEQQHSENYRAFLELQWNASCKDAWNMSVSNQKLLEVYEVLYSTRRRIQKQGRTRGWEISLHVPLPHNSHQIQICMPSTDLYRLFSNGPRVPCISTFTNYGHPNFFLCHYFFQFDHKHSTWRWRWRRLL